MSQREQFEEQTQLIQKTLKDIKNVLVVMSGKGGVGKSTVSTNLALAFAEKGQRVGLLDVDIHGPDIPKMLGIEGMTVTGSKQGMRPVEARKNLCVVSMALLPKLGNSPIIWRGPIKMGVIRQFLSEVEWGPLDYLIVDLPPGTGDEPLSIAQLMPERARALIVTTPQEVALLDVRKSIGFAQQLNMSIAGIIENMNGLVCPHCQKEIFLFKKGGGRRIARETEVPLLASIPFDPQIVESGDTGSPFVLDNSGSKAGNAFREIIEHLSAS